MPTANTLAGCSAKRERTALNLSNSTRGLLDWRQVIGPYFTPGVVRITVAGLLLGGLVAFFATPFSGAIAAPRTALPLVPTPPPLACGGYSPTIVGTAGPDVIFGTAGPDVIASLEGNDVIYGDAGEDVICAGDDDDSVFGGDGRDLLFGDNGDDIMDGGNEDDRLFGGSGDDQLSGGSGNDTLGGGDGDDLLDGGVGGDALDGGLGVDICTNGETVAGCDSLEADVATVPPGSTAEASVLPDTSGEAGASATLTNNTLESGGSIVTVATFASNPENVTIFDVGAGFVDVNVSGADPSDTVAVEFYYPSTVTGGFETGLQLLYFDGTAWVPVLSSGGALPVKNTADHQDGTISGGTFGVVFDNTSTPKITELTGTLFTSSSPPTDQGQCKKDGWRLFVNPSFKNQGDCVSYVASKAKAGGNP